MRVIALSLIITATIPAISSAHHAYRVAYDFNKLETLHGRVVRLELVNPHARLYINVTNPAGQVEEWLVEGPGRLALVRRGWSDDMFSTDQAITAIGNPSSAGHRAIWLEKIVMPDGSEIVDPLIADQLAIEAERRERIRRASENGNN